MRAPAAIVAVLLAAAAAAAPPPTATPGLATRAGEAVDRALSGVQDEFADSLLKTRVRVALLDRLAADGLGVTIDARDGEVTLSGELPGTAEVDAAVAAARGVSGVRKVRNEVRLVGSGAPRRDGGTVESVKREAADALLAARVRVRLVEQLGTLGFTLGVTADRGVVTLKGRVSDEVRLRLVLEAVRATGGVREVKNRIEVGP